MPRRQAEMEYRDHASMLALFDRETEEGVRLMMANPDWVQCRADRESLRGSTCIHLVVGQKIPGGYEPRAWLEILRPLFVEAGCAPLDSSASCMRCFWKVF